MADPALEKELNAIKEDMARLRTDLGELTQAMKGLAADRATDAGQRLDEEVRAAREVLERKLREAEDMGADAVGEAHERIGRYPFTSMLTAFGVGFILAKMMELGGRR